MPPPGPRPASRVPTRRLFLHANGDNADLLIWGKTFGGNRYTGLGQITKRNVTQLRKAWVTPINDDGEEEASPLIYRGNVYVSTAHDGVLAFDDATGKLRWAFPYNPSYELQYAVNRGVGLGSGRIYIATEDCRIVALGPASGSQAGTVPYTSAQVASGTKLYAQQCSSCHGAKLQGISAPALTGSGFGHANLSVSQIRTIVTQQMPLSSPGSLKPDQYAAILAYLFSYNCIHASGGDKSAFPTRDEPAFKAVAVRGATCPVK